MLDIVIGLLDKLLNIMLILSLCALCYELLWVFSIYEIYLAIADNYFLKYYKLMYL